MKNYDELTEDLQQEAKRWQPEHYAKWSYMVRRKFYKRCN